MRWVIVISFIIILTIGFFVLSGEDEEKIRLEKPETNEAIGETEETNQEPTNSGWRTTELTDVRTGETFTIDQFDKPIILESFAVWCPTCTKQQWEIRDLHKDIKDSAISISLDTDPNEDRDTVLNHLTANNFDWYYAIAPREMTQSLIDEFGITVANAPSAPIILINENKEVRLLRNGVKSSTELKGELRL